MRGAILVLSCNKPKYNKERFEQWAHTLQYLAIHTTIFYLFGESDTRPPVPDHPNVHILQVNTGDYYENIPQKMYQGFKHLSYLNFDFVIKIDETIYINNIEEFWSILNKDITEHAYISLNGTSPGDGTRMCLSTCHMGKVSETLFNTALAIIINIPYAGGPCYALRKDALFNIDKKILYSSLYEDYAIGMCMHLNGIKLHESETIAKHLLTDKINSSPINYLFPTYSADYDLMKRCWSFSSPEKTCTVLVHGGLGNQLFQIAIGIQYACKNNMKLQLGTVGNNVRPYYWGSLLQHYSHIVTSNITGKVYNEPSFSHSEIPSFDSDIILNGYFQSSKYFKFIRRYIRNLVCLPDISGVLAKYSPITDTTVFVHARKGDYLNALAYHGVLGEDYYRTAICKMRELVPDAQFIVSSDDPQFWKESPIFTGLSVEHIDEDDITTFAIMARVKNFIIANSSFSWWGAVVADATNVIAPRNWFGPKGPKDTADIYEPSWSVL